MKFILQIILQTIIGTFFVCIWDIDIVNIGFWRWMIGWILGMFMLTGVYPNIQKL